MSILSKSVLCFALVVVGTSAGYAEQNDHVYPALGAVAQRKVEVAWNRFHDTEGLHEILQKLNEAFPDLTRLYSIGKSTQGRDLWCLEVTAFKNGNPRRKPGMYIDGNIHGNEVQGGEAVAYTAWYLCHQYGRIERITELLDRCVFYLIPTVNPDGRDYWLHDADATFSGRSGMEPFDNDHDGVADEDDFDDLNGDGVITMMRIKDPHGRYKPHPDYPKYLMIRVEPGERGTYSLLGGEGIDNDGDGRINEDRKGGYDLNRNWGFDWQPQYIQSGAMDYPFSQPETRAVAGFILKHPNIAAAQSYHNTGGMILRGPGREGGEKPSSDDHVWRTIAERGTEILPYYRSMVIYSDLYTVWGGELDWFYGARGILTFTDEMWTSKNLYKTGERPSDTQEIDFMENVLMGEGLVAWEPFDHPTYGRIEIGGTAKEWGRTPPSFLLEEELHRNMAFTLYHAEQTPLVNIADVTVEKIDTDLYKVKVTIENQRLIPTRVDQDVRHHISSPDIVSLRGPEVKVLSSGIALDSFFQRVNAVERRPHRIELNSIPGMDVARVQYIVTGRGDFTVTVNSVKGGLFKKTAALNGS